MVHPVTISFFVFLAMFVVIGVYSATRRTATPDDYLLASRNINPWLVALSAVATQNSGFMFVGLTAAAYTSGVAAAWLMIGWIVGDYAAWFVVHKRLRQASRNVNTVPDYLGLGMKRGRIVGIVAALVTLVFLGIYASAQLTAGSIALINLPAELGREVGIIIAAVIVVAYCFAGGIRASIWTDAAQSIVMIVSMSILVVVSLAEIGGFGALGDKLTTIDPALTDWGMDGLKFGLFGYLAGWVLAGFGVVGQPHVMVRVMTLDDPKNMDRTRRIYMTWFIAFSAVCVIAGLCARVLLGGELLAPGANTEDSFPLLSSLILPDILVGLSLAGLFAATVSTADSQILSCSAALTQDLFPRMGKTYAGVKAGTLIIAAFAMGVALYGGSVFSVVIAAWSGLAATLGPLMIVRSMRWPINAPVALAMMAAGLATVLVWLLVLDWGGAMYEALPGMAAGMLVYGLGRATVIGKSDGKAKG
jgi:sodium/proline symporter